MSELRASAVPAALFTLALFLAFVFQPVPFGLAFRAWLVALGAVAATTLIRSALAPYPRVTVGPFRLRSRGRPPGERPAGLEEVERAVDFSGWNAADLRNRLRPLLREVAAHRLRARRGVDLERDPAAARALLGEGTWQLLEDAGGPELLASESILDEALARLEAL